MTGFDPGSLETIVTFENVNAIFSTGLSSPLFNVYEEITALLRVIVRTVCAAGAWPT